MKFGQFTNPYKKDIARQVKHICKWADFVEFFIEPPYGTIMDFRRKKSKILKILKENDKFAIGHTGWWMDFATTYDSVRKAWINEAKEHIKLCKEFGIKKLNFHTYVAGGKLHYKISKKILIRNYIKSMKEIVRYAKKNNVAIMCENTPGNNFSTFKDYKYIMDKVPGLLVHLDLGHCYLDGKLKGIDRYINVFKDKIAHVHLSDNFGKDDDHLQVGDGKINYKRVMRMLQKINYKGTVTPEIFEGKGGVKGAVKKLKRYLK